ncbi:hypothetical protein H0H93_008167, partial [Arthromyces matolae]
VLPQPIRIFEGLKESHTGEDSRRRITKHVHEQFTTRMVDAALGWADQGNESSVLPGKCHANDEALSSVDKDPLPPTPISSLLSLPNPVEVEDDMVVVESSEQASPIPVIESKAISISPVPKKASPSPPGVLVEEHSILTNVDEDPIKFEFPGLLKVPEPVLINTDSTEQFTPSPKTPSTLGPLSYLASSPLPSPPSSPPPPPLPTTLGLGLHLLGGLPQPTQVAAPPPAKTSPNLSPVLKNHTPRKSRPDSSEYLISPPSSEIFDIGRQNFKTDKVSELPNHFLPLPFAEGIPVDIVSAPKRTAIASKLALQATTPIINEDDPEKV